MGLFKFLPKAERFCWCTRNLKCASFIIIFMGMISSIITSAILCKPVCKELYNVSSPIKLPVNILRWILFTSEMLLLASAFAFLLGIFWSIRITADIFIVSILLKCFLTILYASLIIVQEHYAHCRWYNTQIFNLIVYTIMWCYFVIIINAYEGQIE
ncbi:uncharacterized protein LOC125067516 [Vanessa atalanta]|uniref:uncharacterized protein LOC125067516 n=1 Tax=Vanessa atalanta TaxID=42275 RepID=UPI001FCD31A9|nr:uncharacterized protein LOC125067516 [Vanessa atalanta]